MQHVFHPSPTCSNRKFGMLAGHSANNPQKTRSVTFELLKAHKKMVKTFEKIFHWGFCIAPSAENVHEIFDRESSLMRCAGSVNYPKPRSQY